MSVSSSTRRGAATLLCVALMAATVSAQAPPPAASQPADATALVFVVNRKNPVESLSLADVRKLLLGERSHWPDGDRVTVVMREPKDPERDAVIRLVCKLDDRDYTRMVLRAVFTGELRSAPKLLDTSGGVIRFVYNVPGAIGYIRASEVDDNVKVIRLSGAPADTAFGFRLKTP
jgi:ABC-type phosphate transport system substrate-binding protein